MGSRVDNLISLAKFAILGEDEQNPEDTKDIPGSEEDLPPENRSQSENEVSPCPLRPSSSTPDLSLVPLRQRNWTGNIPRAPSLAATVKWKSFDNVVTSLRRNQFRLGYNRQISAPDSFQHTALGQFVALTVNVRQFSAKRSSLGSPGVTSGFHQSAEDRISGRTNEKALSSTNTSDQECSITRRLSSGSFTAGGNTLLQRLCVSNLERHRGGRVRSGMESGLKKKCQLNRKAFRRVYSMMPRDSIESPNSEEMSPADTTGKTN